MKHLASETNEQMMKRELIETNLQGWGGQQDIGGLDHVSCMDAIMVCYISVVVLLQCHHVGNECVYRDFKGFQQVSFLWITGSRHLLL